MHLQFSYLHHYPMITSASPLSSIASSSSFSHQLLNISTTNSIRHHPFITTLDRRRARKYGSSLVVVVASSSSNAIWEPLMPDKSAFAPPSLSDIIWPSAGAFAAMAILGKIDTLLAPRGISLTIAPLGAVCAVLFTAPSSPAARKYNMFMSQIGCAAIGVIAFSLLGPGWLARSTSLAASIAFMIYTRSSHPPAASLPLLFIDGPKLHHLSIWFSLFPCATACILLCFIQEIVSYLKGNLKF